MTDEAMSPLRRRMIEDMTIRKFAPKTQHDYIRSDQELRRVPRPLAGHGELRGRAPLPAASGGERRSACRPSISTVAALRFFFRVTLERHDIVEHTHFRPRAAQAAGRSEPGGGGAAAGCGAGPQVQGGAERGLWRGPARLRGGLAQGLRHRQQAHGDPRRAGQGPQGPLRDAVAASARAAARLVEGGAPTGLAVSGPRSGAADDDAPAQSRLPCRGADGRDRQARIAAHACGTASPPICWSRTSTSA